MKTGPSSSKSSAPRRVTVGLSVEPAGDTPGRFSLGKDASVRIHVAGLTASGPPLQLTLSSGPPGVLSFGGAEEVELEIARQDIEADGTWTGHVVITGHHPGRYSLSCVVRELADVPPVPGVHDGKDTWYRSPGGDAWKHGRASTAEFDANRHFVQRTVAWRREGHQEAASRTWKPKPHAVATTRGWDANRHWRARSEIWDRAQPGAHDLDASLEWRADRHDLVETREWEGRDHGYDASLDQRLPDHSKAASAQEYEPGHAYEATRYWERHGHSAFLSRTWPDSHERPLTREWKKHGHSYAESHEAPPPEPPGGSVPNPT